MLYNKPGLNTQDELRDPKLIIKVEPCLLIYRVMDTKTVSITSVTIINTLIYISFKNMYIPRYKQYIFKI